MIKKVKSARKTLKEKWDECLARLEKRSNEFILNKLGNNIPQVIYRVNYIGEIEILNVDKVIVRHRLFYYNSSKPSNKELAILEKECDLAEFDANQIQFNCSYGNGNGYVVGNVNVTIEDIYKGAVSGNIFLNKEDAENYSKDKKDKIAVEKTLVSAGTHTYCYYCKKIVPLTDVVTYTLYNIRMYGRAGREQKFCSSKCATSAQMSLEG
jgi:hypothetical protein